MPVKGNVKITANIAHEMDQWRDLLHEHMEKQRWSVYGTLREMLASCLSGYERIAADALNGAASVRDDMLIMLRAAVLVCESIEGDHLNHSQKNERIRGLMGVLERAAHKLREERFNFSGSAWQRGFDVFRQDWPERRLREKIEQLEARILELDPKAKPETDEPASDEVPY